VGVQLLNSTRSLWVGLAVLLVATSARVPGGALFSIGAMLLALFAFRLWVSPARGLRVIGELEESQS
jgi:hypothetical protein